MFLENSFVPKNTPVHNLNPIVKFIIFLAIIFLLFLRISFLIQLFLFGFAALITWKSDCFHLWKRILTIYAILFVFLYVVNFFFMKTPGFWSDARIADFNDVMGIISKTGSRDEGKLMYGWFWGGQVLKCNDGRDWVGDTESVRCLEKYLGISSGPCSNSGHANHDDWKNTFQNLSQAKNWNIFPIVVNGRTRFAAFSPTWYTVSAYQVAHAFVLSNKIILIILLSAIFTETVSLSSFVYALEDLFKPLKFLKLPNKIMALTLAIAIRFVPSLITESFRITRAQASRGIDYKNGKFRDKASALLSLFVPLFVISFIKAGELSEAMIARGYNHHHPRTSFKVYTVRLWELIVLFCSVFFLTCLYYFFVNSFYMGLFMNFETLILMAR